MISYLQADNIAKRIGDQLLFENINLNINKEDKVDIINNNTDIIFTNDTPETKEQGDIILSKREQNYISGAVTRTLAHCEHKTFQ